MGYFQLKELATKLYETSKTKQLLFKISLWIRWSFCVRQVCLR